MLYWIGFQQKEKTGLAEEVDGSSDYSVSDGVEQSERIEKDKL